MGFLKLNSSRKGISYFLIILIITCTVLTQITLTTAISDDSFEENDTIGVSKLISNGNHTNLIQFDLDYYYLSSDQSGLLRITVSSQVNTLKLHILAGDGTELNGSMNSNILKAQYFFPEAGYRYFMIDGADMGDLYNITVDYLLGNFADDSFEENDGLMSSQPINFGNTTNLKQYDTDWYFFTTPSQACPCVISLYHSAPPYMINMQVLMQNGSYINQNKTDVAGKIQITFNPMISTIYNIKVSGTNEGWLYSLEIYSDCSNSNNVQSNSTSSTSNNTGSSSSSNNDNSSTSFVDPLANIPGYSLVTFFISSFICIVYLIKKRSDYL